MKKRGKKEWNVYILRCGDNTLYTGIAKNVGARLVQHQSGKGAAYTRTHLPVELIYQENGVTRSAALIREAAIKRLPRPKKEKLLLAAHRLIAAGLITGTLVTALEGVCTGQVYVPTLVMLAKSGQEPGRAVSYLLVYNLVSDIPLLAILILTYFGMKTQTLIEWSKKNVVISKLLLGFFFLAMAVLIAAM